MTSNDIRFNLGAISFSLFHAILHADMFIYIKYTDVLKTFCFCFHAMTPRCHHLKFIFYRFITSCVLTFKSRPNLNIWCILVRLNGSFYYVPPPVAVKKRKKNENKGKKSILDLSRRRYRRRFSVVYTILSIVYSVLLLWSSQNNVIHSCE